MNLPSAFLLDIEGTTTPIDFVAKTLFPYARAKLPAYLAENSDDADLRADARLLAEEYDGEAPGAPAWPDRPSPAGMEPYLMWLMDHDRKSPGLKSIQGRIWEEGYALGELVGEVYSDVEPAIRRWRSRGASIQIYSSGSVLAQRLLFGHLTRGSLLDSISGYYDTEVGPKRDPSSYAAIAARLGCAPNEILFLSDVVEEVNAARAAGLASLEVRRDGKTGTTEGWIKDFASLT